MYYPLPFKLENYGSVSVFIENSKHTKIKIFRSELLNGSYLEQCNIYLYSM